MNLTGVAKIAHQIHTLFNQGKLAEVLELAAEDVEIVFVATGQTFRGREGLLSFMRGFNGAFPDMDIQWTNHVESSDQVACEATWSGTHTGPLPTPAGILPATGKRVEGGHFCEVMRFRGGKLARLVNYQDPSTWIRQLTGT